jgi:Skp family chaperone for outer membrane proteins
VKRSFLTAVLTATVAWVGLAGGPAAAQQPPRAQGPTTIALVDVGYVLRKHPRLKAQRDEIRADIERTQADFKQKSEALNKKIEHLQEFRPGTQDYKALEEEIVNEKAKFQGAVTLQKRDFTVREAKIMYNAYQEIAQEVQYYATANNIGLVINFEGDRINPENPDDILRGISRQVLFYTPDIDITPIILKRLDRPVARPGAETMGVPFQR